MPAKKTPKLMSLGRALALLKSRRDAEQLLSILLSPREIVSVNKRWNAFQMVIGGDPQRAIAKDLQTSIATVSRAARVIREASPFVRKLIARS